MGKRFWGAAAGLGLGASLLGVTVSTAQAATADLAIVSNTANVRHAKVGDVVTFTIVAKNNGPDAVGFFVNLAQTLGSLTIVSRTCDRSITADGDLCEYNPPLQPGETLTQTLHAQVQATGSRFATDNACEYVPGVNFSDPNPNNACATGVVLIIGPRQACAGERARIGRTAFREKYGLGRYHLFAMRRCINAASK